VDFNYPSSGGGGGAGGAGANAVQYVVSAGGAGLSSSITGSSVTRAAGGTGSTYQGGGNASANTGSGGNGAVGNGGSGFVVLKFADSAELPDISAGLTYSASISGGFRIIQFTAGTGTVTW
jgi:hypothetical protein